MKAPTSIEQAKPWEAEGISRRTWFRRQASAKAASASKPKAAASPTTLSALDLAAATSAVAPTPSEFEASARIYVGSALESLKAVMIHSESDPARVSAANTILDRAFGKPSADTGVDMMLPLFDQVFLKSAPGETIEAARKLAPIALAVLRKIAENSPSDSARAAACKAVLARSAGSVSPARLDVYQSDSKAIGKKEQAAVDAATAGAGTDWGDDLNPQSPPSLN